MDLCVLPQTGAGEQWLLVVTLAAVIIAAGVALATSGRARRSVLTGLGALAIVGALVAGGIGGAPSAQADAGSAACVTAPARQAPAAAAIVVTPGIPTTTAQCAAEPTLQVPTTTGVVYSQTRTGSSVTVTATAAPGYALLAGAVTSWTYDLTPSVRVPWPVALPASTQATPSGQDAETGGSYLTPSDPALVPALQDAALAGALTYALDASEFAIELPLIVSDPETGVELARPVLSAAVPSELSYDFERGEYLLSFDGNPEVAAEQFQVQFEAILAQYPGADIGPGGEFPFDLEYNGLQILASYEPGVACATETAIVPIELVLAPIGPPIGRASLTDELMQMLEAADAAAASSQQPAAQVVEPAANPEAPFSEAPVSDAPVAEEPVVEAPVADQPVVEDEDPVVEP
jgi:hypothetical protein